MPRPRRCASQVSSSPRSASVGSCFGPERLERLRTEVGHGGEPARALGLLFARRKDELELLVVIRIFRIVGSKVRLVGARNVAELPRKAGQQAIGTAEQLARLEPERAVMVDRPN